ncbi:CBS domain-containing protein [Candidatus Nitrososphaera gargensis Ga9.2]|uniref:CBS domain-containing protein n=1 Tax=Nitrososphaera gargensis (strain Ga9.2) TaxID=1237085 RepID=K0IIQ8_NITGG|nr:CBS domain-containing protein [Candidatus Nitrososphaera gargensis]AFU58958.1 CBS domain-containing protein [Candidatus Nitrososphaera gargensis Ga9.2]
MQLAETERPIFDIVPHIFKRPLLSASPSDPLLQVATFLAIGPQIYVDGVVVLDNHKVVGAIGGRHIIEHILYHPKGWLQGTASMVMSRFEHAVQVDYPLSVALDIFSKTGFAFVPITVKQSVVTSLSIRDVLRVAMASKLDTPIDRLSSPLVAVKSNTSIGDALEIMLEQGIRNLIVKDNNSNTGVLNDRKMLEYLLSYGGRETVLSRGLDGLFETQVNILDLAAAKSVNRDTPAGLAAELLLDLNAPCLLLDNGSIVTPWDVVMKGLRKSKS